MSQLPQLATNFLNQIDIPVSAVTGYFNTDKFNLWEPSTLYYVGQTIITNIEFRAVNFRRTVDGLPIVGGDSGSVYFGEFGKICQISLNWHYLERAKLYPAVSQKAVIDFLRRGKAIQGLLPENYSGINWPAVKSVTVKKAWPSYYSGSTDSLYPYLALWTTVETATGKHRRGGNRLSNRQTRQI